MKEIYILKEMNETHLKRTYAVNRLKRFKIKDVENLSTKQIEIHEILNIMFENSIEAIRKLNIINKNVQVNDEVRNETVRNTAKSSNANNQVQK